MTSITDEIIDALQDGDLPLYSAYASMRRHVDGLSLEAFLESIDELVHSGAVNVFAADHASHGRMSYTSLPPDLAEKYAAFAHTDVTFDPFRLNVELTGAATARRAPWQVDLDLVTNRFTVRAEEKSLTEALTFLGDYVSSLRGPHANEGAGETAILEGSLAFAPGASESGDS